MGNKFNWSLTDFFKVNSKVFSYVICALYFQSMNSSAWLGPSLTPYFIFLSLHFFQCQPIKWHHFRKFHVTRRQLTDADMECLSEISIWILDLARYRLHHFPREGHQFVDCKEFGRIRRHALIKSPWTCLSFGLGSHAKVYPNLYCLPSKFDEKASFNRVDSTAWNVPKKKSYYSTYSEEAFYGWARNWNLTTLSSVKRIRNS